MAKAWVPHVVQQGEHLRGIAFRCGVTPDAIWSHAKNDALTKQRKNRDMLCPGDLLFVPGEPPEPLTLSVGTVNAYKATVPKTPVKLHFDPKGSPVANKAFEVHGAGGEKPITGTVSGDGAVEFEVPVNVRWVEVTIPEAGIRTSVHVGDLDPIDEPSGVTQRLRNLGLLPLKGDVSDEAIAAAIRVLQKRKGLPVTGTLDDPTKAAVAEAHKS
jgi:hypothetical protein